MSTTANPASPHWNLTTDSDSVMHLTLDKQEASANSLSRAVMEELETCLDEIERCAPRGLIVASAKAGFIAGADIKEFVGIQSPQQALAMIREGQQVLDRLAALQCPSVAAINGFALGGGLELALACRYRVVADDASITLGYPEVQLGVHPGLGGTVRTIQLCGPIAAMDLMLTGRSVRPRQALQMGLIDRLAAPGELLNVARQIVLKPPAPRRMPLRDRLLNWRPLRMVLAKQMKARVAKRARPDHYPAPFALIDLWRQHGGEGLEAMQAEARSMAELLCTPSSRNLVRVFFLQERLKASAKIAAAEVQHVHVVGAGVMGGDIATWCAVRGLTVTLQDRAKEYVEPAIERAREFVGKRYPDVKKREQTLARLSMDVAGQGVARADLVIEAIFENLAAKRELYAHLEPQMQSSAILATNTSSIVLEQLAEKLAAPERLVGLHFFNPVPRMPLVEVIRSESTENSVVQRALAFTRQIDKLAVVCRSSPGFLVNRVLMPYLSEAVRAAEEGIPLAIIDRAAEDFGMPMGPIELADVVGLDVIMSVGKVFFQTASEPVPQVLLQLHEKKRFGKKSGAGFYTWREGKPQKMRIDRPMPADLMDRLILPLINESIAVLREQIVDDADLVDAGVIFGAGFAPFRGGPINHARHLGVHTVVAKLETLQQVYGNRFAPDAGWQLLQ